MAGHAGKWFGKLALLGWAALLLVSLLLLYNNYLRYDWVPPPDSVYWQDAGRRTQIVQAFNNTAFSSDNLLCWEMCSDVVDGRLLAGWHLPAAPYLFPDVLLLLPIRCLTADPVVGFGVYCFTFYLLVLATLIWIARLTGLAWREAGLLSCAGLVLLLATFLSPAYARCAALMVHAGNHVGAILLGLGMMVFVLRALRWGLGWPSAGLAVAAGALGVLSDRLLLVQFLAPACLVLLALVVCRRVPWRRAAGLAAVFALAALLSFPLRVALGRLGFQMLWENTDVGRVSRLALSTLLNNLRPHLQGQYVLLALFPLHLLAAVAVAIAWFRREPVKEGTEEGESRPGLLFVALFLLVSPLCNIAALLWTRNADHPGVPRYLLSCFLLPFLFSGLLLRWLPGRPTRSAVAFRLAVFTFAICQAILFLPTVNWRHFEGPYPPLARELDRLARERGPMRGLAGFWSARHLTALSREGVRINVVMDGGQPWLHANCPDRYLSADPRDLRLPAFNFIIVSDQDLIDPDIRPEGIEREYGPPREKIAVDRRQIWLYDEVRNPKLEKFLLGQLAQRLRHAGRPIGPTTPAGLARPRVNMTSWDAADCQVLQPGQSLEVRFAAPLCGAILDLSAYYNNRYLLTFYHDERRVGTLGVAAVPWTGVAYGEPGLQSRLLPLPDALRTQPWNRVVIKPVGESAHFSIGHFLVWPDAHVALPSPRPLTPRRLEAEKLLTTGNAAQLTEAEPSASGGQVRHAPPGFTGALAFGPYLELPPGRYRAAFVLRVGPGPSGPIATLDVRTDAGVTLLGEHILTANDLPSSGGYTPVSVTFSTDLDVDNVEFRLFPAGTRDVWLDCIDLLPLPSQP
jgi:hypothetical protein